MGVCTNSLAASWFGVSAHKHLQRQVTMNLVSRENPKGFLFWDSWIVFSLMSANKLNFTVKAHFPVTATIPDKIDSAIIIFGKFWSSNNSIQTNCLKLDTPEAAIERKRSPIIKKSFDSAKLRTDWDINPAQHAKICRVELSKWLVLQGVSIYFKIYGKIYLLFLNHHLSKPLQKTPSRSGDNFK